MAGIKATATKPEVFLRKALHGLGFRFRLGGCGLPGKPDLVFPSKKTVVLVHGCFWHCHNCNYFKWPKNNEEFWRQKLEGNRARDLRTTDELQKLGWQVITIWECELRATKYTLPNDSVDRISRILTGTHQHCVESQHDIT